MSETIQVQEGIGEIEGLESLDMADLRRLAKILGITSQRDWKKEDYLAAINEKQHPKAAAVGDPSKMPPPGYARVIVHRDPTPGHRNNAIHVGVNGHIFGVPRGVEVDLPIPFMEALANAITIEKQEREAPSINNPNGRYTDSPKLSYPFQVISVTPGEYVNPHDSRARVAAIRKQFNDKHGKWPTHGELSEYRKSLGA